MNFATDRKCVKSILKAMSFTLKDLKEDYKKSISETSENGISMAVWARRSDILEKEFQNDDNVKVLHIQRCALFQINPVLDISTGTLYLLFTYNNLKRVRRNYLNKGTSSHYSVSFLFKNEGILPYHEQLELIPLDDDEKSRREKDAQKMLDSDLKLVEKVIIIDVSYVKDNAFSAKLELYAPNFQMIDFEDVTDLLDVTLSIGNNPDPDPSPNNKKHDNSSELLVSLNKEAVQKIKNKDSGKDK